MTGVEQVRCSWCVAYIATELWDEHLGWHRANGLHHSTCPRAGKGNGLLAVATGLLQPCTCGLSP